jgi:hypothetical protein
MTLSNPSTANRRVAADHSASASVSPTATLRKSSSLRDIPMDILSLSQNSRNRTVRASGCGAYLL